MTARRVTGVSSKVCAITLIVLAVLAVCAPSAFALFSNGGFETGTFASWGKSTYLNPGLVGSPPFTGASIVRNPGGNDLTQIRGPFATMSQTDPNTGNVLHYPQSGSYCAVVNFQGNNRNANSLTQTGTVTAGDVAPDGMVHVQFAWAAVVQNPAHTPSQQPYVYVALRNVTKGTLLYESFQFAGTAVWHDAAGSVQYTDWLVFDIASDSTALAVGDQVALESTAAGCSLGGHWGYLYVDSFGAFYPVTPHITAADKIFDGTTAATITSRTLTGVVPGDDVSLTGGTATFDTALPGIGKTVTATGLSLTGADAGKYMLTSFTATTTADITDVPTVTTTAPSATSAANADGGGDVTSDGYATVTARGVCWSTAASPTTADNHTTDGTGTGTFTSSLTGLSGNTTYHVRAYATNSAGTSYGADLAFTTPCSVDFVTDGTVGATLTGSASQSVALGGDADPVTANAPVGHHFVNWTLSDGSSSSSNPLTITAVAGDITATAHFAIDTFAIDASGGPNGTISPSGTVSVDYGTDQRFIFTSDANNHVADVLIDGVSVGAPSSYTFSNVTAPHTIAVSFAIDTFTLSYAAGAGGSIAGSASQTVDYGGSGTQVTAVPDAHYHFTGWSDGVTTAERTDTNVTADLSVTATFTRDTIVIDASAGPHGSISPSGAVSVDDGADRSFTITADALYHVADVLVDGVSVGAVTSYTFTGVTGAHTIVASFSGAPPITTVKGLDTGWSKVRVKPSVVAGPGPGGAPVDYTEYRVGSGAWSIGTSLTSGDRASPRSGTARSTPTATSRSPRAARCASTVPIPLSSTSTGLGVTRVATPASTTGSTTTSRRRCVAAS